MGYLDMSGAAYRRDGLGADDSMTVDPAMAYSAQSYIEWLAKIEVYTESGGGGGGAATLVTYNYDAGGDRIRKIGPTGNVTHYFFNGLDVAYEEEQTPEGTTKYYYIHALGRHIAKVESDGQGSGGGTTGSWTTTWDAQVVSGVINGVKIPLINGIKSPPS